MSLLTLSEWLRCPNCALNLTPGAPLVLSCQGGHRFDVNKRGYATLITHGRRLRGDSAAMVEARASFLGKGWYEPLRSALTDLVARDAPGRILDIGCGSGYYVSGVLAAIRDDARALGLDVSPAAVARTVAGRPGIDGLVADVWSPLPVRDAAADVILTVFAPRNPTEFHRTLRPDGLLAVVVPQDSHLQELRASGLALDVQPAKVPRLAHRLDPYFSLESRFQLSSVLRLEREEVAALIGMGPSSHHVDVAALHRPGVARTVTTSFELLGFRRRAHQPG